MYKRLKAPEPTILIKEVIKEVEVVKPVYVNLPPEIREIPSSHLVEEIKRLNQQLLERDQLIAKQNQELTISITQLAEKDQLLIQVTKEKQEIAAKLDMIELSTSTLMKEVVGLKEDKADLRADKAKLYEEITFLRNCELVQQEKILKMSKILDDANVAAKNHFIEFAVGPELIEEKSELLGQEMNPYDMMD